MSFLDRLFGRKKRPGRVEPPTRRYPGRSIISDPDLKRMADLRQWYPLPEGFEFRERKEDDFVVVRLSDGQEFVFLVEEGILTWEVPYTRSDGSTGHKTTEVLKQAGRGSAVEMGYQQRGFPLGRNSIDDPDIRAFADLGRHYPLPAGFEYRQTAGGVPVVYRMADGKSFHFLIEEELLGFDEPYTKKDGTTGYKTTEVFKRA
jgi:hypothetical protein